MKNNKIDILNFSINTSLNSLLLNDNRILINTLNPHSYCTSKRDPIFREALIKSDILIPDGIGIVIAAKLLAQKNIKRITGADLHEYILKLANQKQGRIFYLGSMPVTLQKIKKRIEKEYPNVNIATYSPPFKSEFSSDDNRSMIDVINEFKPNVLFVGMTAPKQEKWAFLHKQEINVNIIASIGAVFDFYAGTVKRAPIWIQKIGLEWLHRSLSNPKRLGKRNIISNPEFIWDVLKLKILGKT